MLLVSLRNERNKPFQGKRMSELIAARGGDPADVLFDVLIEENGSVPTVFFHHSEPDMQLVMKQPWTSIGSDGSAVSVDGPTGRHASASALLRHVPARARPLRAGAEGPDAAGGGQEDDQHERRQDRHQGSRPAARRDCGRTSRSSTRTTVIDRATFENPHQYPVGIEYVIVNGAVTIDNEQHTGALAGRVIYGPGKEWGARTDERKGPACERSQLRGRAVAGVVVVSLIAVAAVTTGRQERQVVVGQPRRTRQLELRRSGSDQEVQRDRARSRVDVPAMPPRGFNPDRRRRRGVHVRAGTDRSSRSMRPPARRSGSTRG